MWSVLSSWTLQWSASSHVVTLSVCQHGDSVFYQEAEGFVVCSSCTSSVWQEEYDEVICWFSC